MYWMLEVRAPGDEGIALIGQQPTLNVPGTTESLDWMLGKRFSGPLPEPLEFVVGPYGGDYIPDYFQPSIPLMHDRLLAVLREAGVDNIDSYSAILSSKDDSERFSSFKAVNIIGAIQCADLEASVCEVEEPDVPGGVSFDSLVIDEDRAKGAIFFRLYERPRGLVVIDSVKRVVEAAEFRGIVFIKPADWVG
jgi:hypothetical protein